MQQEKRRGGRHCYGTEKNIEIGEEEKTFAEHQRRQKNELFRGRYCEGDVERTERSGICKGSWRAGWNHTWIWQDHLV